MIYGSVCSGIEAATVAWHPLGWKPAFFSEIEAFPRAVLSHHFPEVPLHGDFTTIQPEDYQPIDLLVGGTPCQSFSIAGLRKGLDDDRGNLALEYLRLADRLRPQWLVWENVPGVLSSNGGRDFGAFLGGLVKLGYGFAYRVLDAQFFGVAQRRRRVFVVGYAGDWRPAAAVLFERESLSGHPAPRRSQGAGAAAAAEGGAGDGGGAVQPFEVANCLTARMHKGINTTVDEGQTPVVVNAPSPPPASEAGHLLPTAYDTAQITSAANATRVSPELPASTLAKGSRMHVAYGFDWQSGGDCRGLDLKPTVQLQAHQTPASLSAMRVRRLTPTECERLQGFPDGYTQVPYRNKPAADGPRYKAIGNSMAVPVMAWIGKRIKKLEQMT